MVVKLKDVLAQLIKSLHYRPYLLYCNILNLTAVICTIIIYSLTCLYCTLYLKSALVGLSESFNFWRYWTKINQFPSFLKTPQTNLLSIPVCYCIVVWLFKTRFPFFWPNSEQWASTSKYDHVVLHAHFRNARPSDWTKTRHFNINVGWLTNRIITRYNKLVNSMGVINGLGCEKVWCHSF